MAALKQRSGGGRIGAIFLLTANVLMTDNTQNIGVGIAKWARSAVGSAWRTPLCRGVSPLKKFLLIPMVALLPACNTEPSILQHLPRPTASVDPAFRSRSRKQTVLRPAPRRRPTHAGIEPGWIPPGGVSSRWECIVIHHSAGEVGGKWRFDRLHRAPPRNWNELGYHFVIGNGSDTAEGAIEVGSRWTKQKHGAHCKTPDNYYNDRGVGICLVGNYENHAPSAAQMQALARLVRFLQQQRGIPGSRILAHGQITGRTACPGTYFSLGKLHAMLAGPMLLSSR